MQEDKNSRSISELDSDSEMKNNNISKTPSNKSNQNHENTINPSSLHSSSLPSTSLPPQCRTQSFFGHTGACTGTGTLRKVLEGALADRQTDKSYGSI